jgi:hypothetical protein
MLRRILVLGAVSGLLALPATSEAASTSTRLKRVEKALAKAQRDIKVVSQRQKDTQAQLDVLVSCLITAPIARFGIEDQVGYLFGAPDVTPFYTTAIDSSDQPDAFQMLGVDCSAPRVARGFFQSQLPAGVR